MTAAVCEIAVRYRRPGGKSLHHLVVESGYFDCPGGLSTIAVANYLRDNPELVDEWLRFSEDKRTAGGWYFLEGDRCFIVGRIDGPRTEHADRVAACAEFIVREMGTVTPPKEYPPT